MKNTILHQIGPEDLREIIGQEIKKHLSTKQEKIYIPKLITAKRLKRTTQTLDAWHRAGILKKKYIGGRVYYNEEDIIRLEYPKTNL